MRVVIATPLYPPETGGPATDAAGLAAHLPSQGIEVDVYPFSQVRHLPRGIRHLRYACGLWRRSRTADAIIAMDTFSVCVPAAMVASMTGTRLVVRVPGDFAWEQAVQRWGVTDSLEIFQEKRYGFAVETLRFFEHWAVRRALLVVACSDYLKGIVAQWGVRSDRLTRIYLGLDAGEAIEPPQKVPEGKILFSLGRMVPWKGFSLLIELLPQLPGWHLVLAGDGPLRGALEAQARTLGVADRVTFLGAVPHAQVLGWLRRADVFALNTSFESFSFQLLEAMMAGIPIVATAIGSIPELVTNGIEGVLCAPGDKAAFEQAIVSTQTDQIMWKSRTEAAKQKAGQFSAAASARAFGEELKTLCA